jgi:hypothetical protein
VPAYLTPDKSFWDRPEGWVNVPPQVYISESTEDHTPVYVAPDEAFKGLPTSVELTAVVDEPIKDKTQTPEEDQLDSEKKK